MMTEKENIPNQCDEIENAVRDMLRSFSTIRAIEGPTAGSANLIELAALFATSAHFGQKQSSSSWLIATVTSWTMFKLITPTTPLSMPCGPTLFIRNS